MIVSMTGYGDAQLAENGVSYALEMRSLNNRYFKCSIKLPEFLQTFETDVERILRSRLERGSITYTLRVRNTSAEAAYDINTAALQAYLDQIKAVRGPENLTIEIGSLLALPGVCQPKDFSDELRESQWKIVERMTDTALEKLLDMRRREGAALREDLLKHTARMRSNLDALTRRAPLVVDEYRNRLTQRVANLTDQAQLELNKDALLREVSVFAERCDISEEISRLASHLKQFERLCDKKEPAGRKLDFIAQEMLREANTIASKANDSRIAGHVVEIKSCVDRLKEQVQNAE